MGMTDQELQACRHDTESIALHWSLYFARVLLLHFVGTSEARMWQPVVTLTCNSCTHIEVRFYLYHY